MTTTSIHPGGKFSQSSTYGDSWGDWSDIERDLLGDALVERFEAMARIATGDNSISWQPYTSEIFYTCVGRSDHARHCLDPLNPWPCDEDGIPTIDFHELLREAGEWVSDHAEEIVGL